jgi:hypothetical protein
MWTDRYGSSVLHILCQARTCDRKLLVAVKSILRLSPEQVAWPNVGTWTPLHFAVEKRLETEALSTSLALQLIRACPSAVSVKTSGFKTKTPFAIACEADADYSVLKAMLKINPSLSSEPFIKRDAYSDSYTVAEYPLQVLWKNRSAETEAKMALLLRAAHMNQVDDRDAADSRKFSNSSTARPFHILHAACSVRCPRDYFLQILRLHPDQVNTPDAFGLYPLHYAVRYASRSDVSAYMQFVIEALLEQSSAATNVADADGRLPLHIAIENNGTWHKSGIRELVYANPNALRQADPLHGLLPFIASAESAAKSRLHLSTTFELLLAAPEMVMAGKRSCREK